MTSVPGPIRASLFLGLTLALTGCGSSVFTSAPSTVVGSLAITGKTMGGQQPVSGSHVFLFAAQSTGNGPGAYGTNAVSLLTTPGGYVTTDATGTFSITGDYTCTAGAQIYAVSIGGSPISGAPGNSAISMMTAIGDCSQLNATSFIQINELSTAAGITALQQFTNVNSLGIPIISSSAAASSGLVNAFSNATALVPFSTGQVNTVRPGVTVPQATLDTLGNVLAGCVNSTGPASTACGALFTATNVSSTQQNTAAAMLSIAQNPGVNVTALYNLSTANPPFQPQLGSAPNDFTVGINLTGGSLYAALNIVIDGTGNAYVFDCQISCSLTAPSPTTTSVDKIVEYSPLGAVLNTRTGPAIHNVTGMALDNNGFLWTANDGQTNSGLGNTADSIGHFLAAGASPAAIFYTSTSLSTPYGVAVDSNSNAYITNRTGQSVNYVTATGTITPVTLTQPPAVPLGIAIGSNNSLYFADNAANGIYRTPITAPGVVGQGAIFSGPAVQAPIGIALDASSNFWFANSGGPNVSLFTNAGQLIGPAVASGFGTIAAIAIDGNSRAWVPSCNRYCTTTTGGNTLPDSIVQLQLSGTSISVFSPSQGYQNPGLSAPAAVAIDGSGNVWVTSTGTPGVTVLLGAAGPVKTPLQGAIFGGTGGGSLGQKP